MRAVTEKAIKDVIQSKGLTEDEFLRRFSYGYLVLGNSALDLLDMLLDTKDKYPFKSLEEVVDYLDDSAEEVGDVLEEDVKDQTEWTLSGYESIEESSMNTIIG